MHVAIVGISGSGKTWLAKRMAADFIAAGKTVIVYDPLKSGDWPKGAKCYSKLKAFSNVLENTESAYIFIDEAKTVFDDEPKLAQKWLYQNRHKGQLIFLIAQRAKMIPPNARNMCSKIFAFRQTKDDAKSLADDYGDELLHITNFRQGAYVYSDGFNHHHGVLNFDTLPPTLTIKE